MPVSPTNILIIRPSALGDVARTVPALVSLRRAFPEARIDWLVRDDFVEAVAAHPALSGVVPYPRKAFGKFGRDLDTTRDFFRYLRDLRGRGYERVYDLQGLFRSGLLTWATGAWRRVGSSKARELASLAYNVRVAPTGEPHAVPRMLDVLAGDGIEPVVDMQLYTTPQQREWARREVESLGLSPGSFAVVAPTSGWTPKRWPAERFGALIDRLRLPAVIVGSPQEREQITAIRGAGRFDLLGRTSVGQLMALIEQAAVVLANDSAALHLAVGLGRRCLGIYGPTFPEKDGPFRYPLGIAAAAPSLRTDRYRGLRDDAVIRTVTVEQAWSQLQKVMENPPPGAGKNRDAGS